MTRALGIDCHKVLSATKHHHTLYAPSFVDVTTGQLFHCRDGNEAQTTCPTGSLRDPLLGASGSRRSPSTVTPGTSEASLESSPTSP